MRMSDSSWPPPRPPLLPGSGMGPGSSPACPQELAVAPYPAGCGTVECCVAAHNAARGHSMARTSHSAAQLLQPQGRAQAFSTSLSQGAIGEQAEEPASRKAKLQTPNLFCLHKGLQNKNETQMLHAIREDSHTSRHKGRSVSGKCANTADVT